MSTRPGWPSVSTNEASLHRPPGLAGRFYPFWQEPTPPACSMPTPATACAPSSTQADGLVVATTASRTTVTHLSRFLGPAEPDRYLFLVWDNRPVPSHHDVLAEAARLQIRLLWLPTYSPWLNPIEKLWRKLRQEAVNGNRLADAWTALRTVVTAFLAHAPGLAALCRPHMSRISRQVSSSGGHGRSEGHLRRSGHRDRARRIARPRSHDVPPVFTGR